MDLAGYQRPPELPPGRILIVGSGQSGCQLAEELHEAGRDVVLACGKAPWAPRVVDGRDVYWWAVESGFMDGGAASLPSSAARLAANILATGHGEPHDLDLRTLRAMGVTLAGHFLGADADRAFFAEDLPQTVAWGDTRFRELMDHFDRAAAGLGVPSPHVPDPEPFIEGGPAEIPHDGFGAVIFAGGFRPDYSSWLPWPEAFDELGFPIQQDGASTVVDGLHFVGVPFLRKRKSPLLYGVGEDAVLVASAIAAAVTAPAGA